jgi:hypothetical protein
LDAIAGEEWLRSSSSNLFKRKFENALGDGFKALLTSPIDLMAGDMYEYGRLQTGFGDYFTGGFTSFGSTVGISFASALFNGTVQGQDKWDRLSDEQKVAQLSSAEMRVSYYDRKKSSFIDNNVFLSRSDLYYQSNARGIVEYFKAIRDIGKPTLKMRLGL